jgi:hypothetical protein
MSGILDMQRDFYAWWTQSTTSLRSGPRTPPVIPSNNQSVYTWMHCPVATQPAAYTTSPYFPPVPRVPSRPSLESHWSEWTLPSSTVAPDDYVVRQCRSEVTFVGFRSEEELNEPYRYYDFEHSESSQPVRSWLDTIRENTVEHDNAGDAGRDWESVATATSRTCTYTPTEIDMDEQRARRERSTTFIGDPTAFPGIEVDAYMPEVTLPSQDPVWTRSDWTLFNGHIQVRATTGSVQCSDVSALQHSPSERPFELALGTCFKYDRSLQPAACGGKSYLPDNPTLTTLPV